MNRTLHKWAPCGHNWSCVILDWSKGPFFWHFKFANACFFSKVYTTMKFQLVCRKYQLVCTPIPERCDWSVQTHWSEGAHVCNTEKVPNTKRGIYQNSLLIDDDRKLNISKSISRNLKDNFQNHKLKHNVSPTFIMKKYQKLEDFLVDIKPIYFMNLINMKKTCYQNPVQMFNLKFGKYFKINCVCVNKNQCRCLIQKFGKYFKLNECVSLVIYISGVAIQNIEDVLV